MGLEVRPLTGVIGAEIVGLSSGDPITEEVGGVLRDALSDWGVVFLRDQTTDPGRHLAVARALGRLKPPTRYVESLADAGFPDIGVIAYEPGKQHTTDRWHTDNAWDATPLRYSVLHMQLCPPAGGDTLWSSQCRAFETLSPPMQQLLVGLTARHAPPKYPESNAVHPLVIVNPASGRRALFCTPLYTARINELGEGESGALLTMLGVHATQPDMICRWKWREGDIGIWDNHYVMHYAVRDYGDAPRRIHRLEIEGSAPVASLQAA